MVVLNGKGMSVAEHWRSLQPHLVPKRLRLTFRVRPVPTALPAFGSAKVPLHLVL